MAILERASSSAPADTEEILSRGLIERLPILGLGILACMSVGYGFGTLVQFDHDWREEPPVLMATVEGSLAQGAAIDQAIEELLATTATPVGDVQCPRAVDVVGGDQLCRARASSGMVTILASGSPGLLSLQVYGTP